MLPFGVFLECVGMNVLECACFSTEKRAAVSRAMASFGGVAEKRNKTKSVGKGGKIKTEKPDDEKQTGRSQNGCERQKRKQPDDKHKDENLPQMGQSCGTARAKTTNLPGQAHGDEKWHGMKQSGPRVWEKLPDGRQDAGVGKKPKTKFQRKTVRKTPTSLQYGCQTLKKPAGQPIS